MPGVCGFILSSITYNKLYSKIYKLQLNSFSCLLFPFALKHRQYPANVPSPSKTVTVTVDYIYSTNITKKIFDIKLVRGRCQDIAQTSTMKRFYSLWGWNRQKTLHHCILLCLILSLCASGLILALRSLFHLYSADLNSLRWMHSQNIHCKKLFLCFSNVFYLFLIPKSLSLYESCVEGQNIFAYRIPVLSILHKA